MPRFFWEAETKRKPHVRTIQAHAVGADDPDATGPRPPDDFPFKVNAIGQLRLRKSCRVEMEAPDFLFQAIGNKGQDLMIRHTGDDVVDPAGYVAKSPVTRDTQDLLLIFAHGIDRSAKGKSQELAKILVPWVFGVFRHAHNSH